MRSAADGRSAGQSLKGVALAACASLVLTACGSSGGAAGAQQSGSANGKTVSAAFGLPLANIDTSPVFLANQLGYFKDEGVDMKITTLSGSSVTSAALQAGSVQFTVTQPLAVFAARDGGIPLVAVSGVDTGYHFDLVLAKGVAPQIQPYPASSVSDIAKAMAHLKIGVLGSGATTGNQLMEIFSQVAAISSLKPIAFQSPTAQVAALKSGQVDGIFLSPPSSNLALDGTGARNVLSTSSLNNDADLASIATTQYAAVVATERFVKSSPETVRRVTKAVARAVNYLMTNPQDAAKALQPTQFSTVPVATLADVFAHYGWEKDSVMTDEAWSQSSALVSRYGKQLGIDDALTADKVKAAYTLDFASHS